MLRSRCICSTRHFEQGFIGVKCVAAHDRYAEDGDRSLRRSKMNMSLANELQTTRTASNWFIRCGSPETGIAQAIRVPIGRFQVGRRTDLNLCLAHPSVSKLHAEFIAADAALFVRDLGSRNGTFVNGQRICEDTPIAERDVVQFAEVEFVVGRNAVGRSSVDRATQTMIDTHSDWHETLTLFHRLMSERSVIPYFQPIVRMTDGRHVGYELLARSAITGLMMPHQMFGAAERIGLAASLSVLCRENGVEIARKLANPGLLFVNTHPSERPHAGLLESLAHLRTLAPNLGLVVELHEGAVTSPREITAFRKELSELGIQLAYDDFGAGQARLLELAEAAPDFLKFDLSLIRNIHMAPQRQQMVAGFVRIVRDLGIQPLAEGIETAGEAEVCREIGFSMAQGYFYGKPVPAH